MILLKYITLLFLFSNQMLYSACINNAENRKHNAEKALYKIKEKTNQYYCKVKRSEKDNFNQESLCLNCQCGINFHDDR